MQNIGGIAKSLKLPAGDVVGCYDCDTGPRNVFTDLAVRHYTKGELEYHKDGATRTKGKVDYAIVDEVLQQPTLILKATGRDTFGNSTGKKPATGC